MHGTYIKMFLTIHLSFAGAFITWLFYTPPCMTTVISSQHNQVIRVSKYVQFSNINKVTQMSP